MKLKAFSYGLVILSLLSLFCCNKNTELPFWTDDPIIQYFNADPSTIDHGQSSTLSWEVTNATKVEVWAMGKDWAGGVVPAKGTKVVTFMKTNTCLLHAYRNDNTYIEKTCTVTVRDWVEVAMVEGPTYMGFANISKFSAKGKVKNIGTKTAYNIRIYLYFYRKAAWGGGLYKKTDWEVADFFKPNEEFEWRLDWYHKEAWDMCKYVDVNNPEYEITWD